MKNKLKLNAALKSRLLGAEGVGQVAEILKSAGQEVSADDIEHLWEEITRHKTDTELSLDELEAVSGGADRDWLINGCAATVEPGSWCGSNDSCIHWSVTYDNKPQKACSVCGGGMIQKESGSSYYYVCRNCNHTEFIVDDPVDKINIITQP